MTRTSPGAAAAGRAADVVAVLPFRADSREERFFAEGVAEEILNRLRRSDGLTVLGRRSSLALADEDLETGAPAAALGARCLVRGSISRSDERLLIRAELVDATGERLWGELYEPTVGDLLAMEADIVDAIAGVLGAGAAPVGVTQRPPDPEAYERFLIGRRMLLLCSHNFDSRTVEELRRAVALGPGYALAHAELAIA